MSGCCLVGGDLTWYVCLVDVELVAFWVGQRDRVVVQAFLEDRVQPRRTERHEPRRLSLDPLAPCVERQTAATARVHADVDAVLDRLLLGDDLEPDARTLTVRILDDVAACAKLVLGTPIDLKKSSHESKPVGGGAIT